MQRIVDAERCYRRGRRKAKDLERQERQLSRGLDVLIYGRARCPSCDKPGPHFVPPSLGEVGFYICDTNLFPHQLDVLMHVTRSGKLVVDMESRHAAR